MCCKVRRQCSSGVAEEMLCTVALSNSSVWFESNPSRDVPPPGVLQAPRTAPEPAPVGGKDGKDGKGGKSGGTDDEDNKDEDKDNNADNNNLPCRSTVHSTNNSS